MRDYICTEAGIEEAVSEGGLLGVEAVSVRAFYFRCVEPRAKFSLRANHVGMLNHDNDRATRAIAIEMTGNKHQCKQSDNIQSQEFCVFDFEYIHNSIEVLHRQNPGYDERGCEMYYF